jgi:hypothetical protein
MVVGEEIHPKVLVPLIVYVVEAEGFTTVLVEILAPEFTNVYVLAPEGVIVAVCPTQILALVDANVNEGVAFTVIVTDLGALTQLLASVPEIEYTVVVVGETTTFVLNTVLGLVRV